VNDEETTEQLNFGNSLAAKSHFAEAIDCYRRILQLRPDYAEVHNNLGAVLQAQGKLSEAIESYRTATILKPDYSEAHNNLGNALLQKKQWLDADNCFRRAVATRPDYAEAWTNLGLVLQALAKLDDAIVCHRRALQINPSLFAAHTNLGCALKEQEKWSEAEQSCRKAVELGPENAEAHNNLGIVLREQGKWHEAADCFRFALRRQPNFAEAHVNKAMLLLISGNLQQGWEEYEWRLRCAGLLSSNFMQPRWNAEPIEEKTILVHAEMGLGDTIQFCRYLPLVKATGSTVVFQCQAPLVHILASCRGFDQLIRDGQERPLFDVQVPLLSLPRIFGTTLETVPSTVPYLFADAALVAEWRMKLQEIRGLRIGINWRGQARGIDASRRDIPLVHFKSLENLPGVRLISLQNAEVNQPLDSVDLSPIIHPGQNFDRSHGAFMDTAAIMMNLDLVITSDTSVAHLAGALGVPVWVALPFAPDWRWLLNRTDSPWYPTMRLFRQKTSKDWSGVFDEILAALTALSTKSLRTN
jgi:tetratricopeptide (TPR) repeat protein